MTTFINEIGSFGGQCSIAIDESLGFHSYDFNFFALSQETIRGPIPAVKPFWVFMRYMQFFSLCDEDADGRICYEELQLKIHQGMKNK